MEDRRLLTAYSHSAVEDFQADFTSSLPGGLPQNNPNGDWTYLASDGTPGTLVATDGVNPVSTFGGGSGWADPTGIPSYTRGPVLGFPADTIVGHGPQRVVWTAPAEVDEGAVELTGRFSQLPDGLGRHMQLRIYKNDSSEPFLTVDADFSNPPSIIPLPVTRVAIVPNDTLTIMVDGQGPMGDGIPTFAAWDVAIEEIDPKIDADFTGDFTVDGEDLPSWQAGYGIAAGANKSDGDANDDGRVSGKDFLTWQRQFGNSIDSGVSPPFPDNYHPAAVIVQTSGVTLPDGTLLDVSGTQTHGLQEAIDYATDGGWDVFVLPGTYSLDAHIDIEESRIRTFRFEDVTLDFDASVTDFGIRFDSTLIVDWYWKGGALNAPGATHGVLFQPRSLHPLDGQLFGTSGVVDSRYLFNVDITAATHKVTMDSTQATINEAYFYFQNALPDQINYVGSGFSETNAFPTARTDDPIPFDLFSTAGRVTVIPPVGEIATPGPEGIATVYLPDGSKLTTTGTLTSGLQEAFDYAASNELDLLVFARGTLNVDQFSNVGLYSIGAELTVGSLNSRMYRIYSVTFNYVLSTGAALTLTDVVNSDFELTGQVVAINAPVDTLIKPIAVGVNNSIIRIQHVPASPTENAVGVLIDPSMQTIEDNVFYFNEVLLGDFGITVANPSASTYFRNNFLSSLHTHDATVVGLQIGQSGANADNIHSNTFEIRTNTDGSPTEVGVQVWGANNTIDYIAINAGLNFGVKFEPPSNDNTLFFGTIQAATPIADFGTNNNFVSNLGADASLKGLEITAAVSRSIGVHTLQSGSLPGQRVDEDRSAEAVLVEHDARAKMWQEFGQAFEQPGGIRAILHADELDGDDHGWLASIGSLPAASEAGRTEYLPGGTRNGTA